MIMNTNNKKNSLGGILALLAFTLFVVSLLAVLLTGADVVKRLTTRDRENYDRMTAVQYVATRIRQSDSEGVLSVGTFGGESAIIISEDIEGSIYNTYVYCHKGSLREMFCAEGVELDPVFGEEIIPMESFTAEDRGEYISITLNDGIREENLCFLLRNRKGEEQ